MITHRAFLDTFQQVGTLEMTQHTCHSECSDFSSERIEERNSLIAKN